MCSLGLCSCRVCTHSPVRVVTELCRTAGRHCNLKLVSCGPLGGSTHQTKGPGQPDNQMLGV